jgi:hypothetical protein
MQGSETVSGIFVIEQNPNGKSWEQFNVYSPVTGHRVDLGPMAKSISEVRDGKTLVKLILTVETLEYFPLEPAKDQSQPENPIDQPSFFDDSKDQF